LFFGEKRDSVSLQLNLNSESFAMAAKKAPAAPKSAAKTPKAAAAPKAGATVTLKHLAAALSENYAVPKKQADAMLGDMVGLVTRHLKKGDKIRLTGLGVLQVRKRAARMGRNPATGEAIKIKASKKVAFRVAKELKEAV
jgi:DNA-binding protein HU-beta